MDETVYYEGRYLAHNVAPNASEEKQKLKPERFHEQSKQIDDIKFHPDNEIL